ncbi:fumarylacetoacetate hydrolase family protein [Paenibacillus sp. 481]|uniref:fumarylacetoacetate hydrolase family protein n=1 Tax=Paenibacillus sp. 481 TaxID=2835869 RepID=UPI001E3DB354|nr:fumarylacetoacetate hydrolase family protein [Paenibacillus sp. 481]UHA72584.1 fumarylacetoacetate hydrolase family protein [Paenibacillus sp. 481]
MNTINTANLASEHALKNEVYALEFGNVYCIGRNYRLHAAELGNEVPDEPLVFLKPSHAVTQLTQETELQLPLHQGAVHHEIELVLRIGRRVEPGMTADDVVDGIALGIDFTLRDVQDVVKKKGTPWLPAKGVLHSAPITPFFAYPGSEQLARTPFSLLRNGESVQQGMANDMMFSFDELIQYVAHHYGLGAGDIIFTGTPAGVGPVQAGDRLELCLSDSILGSCVIGARQQT